MILIRLGKDTKESELQSRDYLVVWHKKRSQKNHLKWDKLFCEADVVGVGKRA